jgi:hypothetical protein
MEENAMDIPGLNTYGFEVEENARDIPDFILTVLMWKKMQAWP